MYVLLSVGTLLNRKSITVSKILDRNTLLSILILSFMKSKGNLSRHKYPFKNSHNLQILQKLVTGASISLALKIVYLFSDGFLRELETLKSEINAINF